MKPDKSAKKPDHFPRLATEPLFSGKNADGTKFNPLEHGIHESLLRGGWDDTGRGQIDHGRWMARVSDGSSIGTCRRCGSPLYAEEPTDDGAGNLDYEAVCTKAHEAVVDWQTSTRHVSGCGASMVAIRGRVMLHSSSLRERMAEVHRRRRVRGE